MENIETMIRAKTIRCRAPGCHVRFEPPRPYIRHCSLECGTAIGLAAVEKIKAQKSKAERKDIKARKERLKTPSDHAKPAQAAINRYVNARDRGKPCISCGKPDHGVRNASHLKSRGSNSALRFHLWNIASACYRCNCELSGNIGGYIKGLEERHPGRVEWLDNQPRSREYSTEYLKRITKIFNKKTKRLLARKS